MENSSEKKKFLPSLNSILYSTSLPELQNISAPPPPIPIPKLQHTSVNHASSAQSQHHYEQPPIHHEPNGQ
ncbi:12055_t:CDS:1, partial [Acaulospora colombiana]